MRFTLLFALVIGSACGSPKREVAAGPADASVAQTSAPASTEATVAAADVKTAAADAAATAAALAVDVSASTADAPTADGGGPTPGGADAVLDKPAVPAPLVPLAAAEGPLYERLVSEVGAGQPVAILPWFEGLVAVSADGARRRLLAPGPVAWALVDERARVVWFGNRSEEGIIDIQVLDLLAASLVPTMIAKGLPNADVRVRHHERGKPEREEWLFADRGLGDAVVVVLDPKRPRLEVEAGYYSQLGIREVSPSAKEIRRAQPDKATKALLAAFATRASGRRMWLPPPPTVAVPERIEVRVSACEDADDCGVVAPFTGTPYWLVIVAKSCGDACFIVQNVYDPRVRAFVDLVQPGRTHAKPPGDEQHVESMFVVADGSAFVMHGAIHRFDKPAVMSSPPPDTAFSAVGGGWLGGQWFVP